MKIGCPAMTRDENGKLIVENIKKAMKDIMSYGVSERVIIHCPEAGFILNREGEFTVVSSIKLPAGYIKGTVGAGDALVGGLLYGLTRFGSLREAFRCGVAAGTASVMTEGTQLIVPEDFMRLLGKVHIEDLK